MKTKIIISAIFTALITAFVISSCSNMISSTKEIVFPDSNVSYSKHVEPFLRYTCGFGGCHNAGAPAGLDVTDYFSLTAYPGLIVPNKPDNSIIIQILDYKLPHNPPLYLNDVTENHRQGMRQWILEGALLIPD